MCPGHPTKIFRLNLIKGLVRMWEMVDKDERRKENGDGAWTNFNMFYIYTYIYMNLLKNNIDQKIEFINHRHLV